MTSIILQQAQQPGGSPWGMIIMIVAMFAIMYFLMIRPQQKQQKKIREFQNALAPGAEVITSGGIHGKVKHIDINANIVELEISRDVIIRVDRGSIFQNPAALAAQPK